MSGWRKRRIVDLGSLAWTQKYDIDPQKIARAFASYNFEPPEPEITDFTQALEVIERVKNQK